MRSILLGLTLTLTALTGVSAPRNVVLIYADDLGYTLGCVGTKGIQTPNTDRLAREGANFTRAFAMAAVCSPSRAAILTGMFPHANGLYRNVPNYGVKFPLPTGADPSDTALGGVHEDVPTLVEILRDQGVFTAISQKTHVQPIRKFPFHNGSPVAHSPAQFSNWVAQVFTEAGSRPVFIMANVTAPHRPFDGYLRAEGRLKNNAPVGIDPAKIEVPDWLPDTPVMRDDLARYYAAVELVDSCVAGIQGGIAKAGAAENTLVIFSGDNGMGYHRAKNTAYPAGTHMVLLFRGPGVKAGQTSTLPTGHVDVMPTILDYLGIAAPKTLQGRSLWPVLRGQAATLPSRTSMLAANNDYYTARAVCDGRYYYITNITQPRGTWKNPPMNADLYQAQPWLNHSFQPTIEARQTHPRQYQLLADLVTGHLPSEELYDLDADLWGVRNLLTEPSLAPRLAQLRRELAEWRRSTGDIQTNAVAEITRRTRARP